MSGFPRLLLDAGALIDAENNPRGKVFIDCRKAIMNGFPPLLPAVVYAQVWRKSPRQHGVAKMGKLCEMRSFTAQTADRVGRLLAASRTSDVVDAAVIVEAIDHQAAVLTSDPDDLRLLAEASGFDVALIKV